MTLALSARLSSYFLPTQKEDPAEAEIASHRLMLRAGMIRQSSSGIYSWLPLGFRVLKKIEAIVRQEQDRAGAQEMLMPTIQPASIWEKSGRYEDYGQEMLKINDRHDRPLLYGPTNEEVITTLFAENMHSYRDCPQILYHIQWKFRDEIRPRFGVMRGREFYMKDAYSFDVDTKSGRLSYNKMFVAYLRTFTRLGLNAIPMVAENGPIGGAMSHEFIILAKTGESQVYCHKDLLEMKIDDQFTGYDTDLQPIVDHWTQYYAATEEQHDESRFKKDVPTDKQICARGVEVGHIFHFGDKYSVPLKAFVTLGDGSKVPVQMGSYGIGVSRLVGSIIEAYHDEKGIIWPESVAPFRLGIINLKVGHEGCDRLSDEIMELATKQNIDHLYDDRNDRAGVKFSDMELIGLPWQITIGPRLAKEGTVELKSRKTGEVVVLSPSQAIEKIGIIS